MAIPGTSQPFPQRQRRVFVLGQGVVVQPITSVPTAAAQGVPGNPASQIVHIGTGFGTVTLSPKNYIGKQSISIVIPLTGLTIPYTPSQQLTCAPGAPTITLPQGYSLGSVSIQPVIRTSLGETNPIAANVIGPGLTIRQFAIQVTFSTIPVLRTSLGQIVISVGMDLMSGVLS
jgi:hypothetical protein